MRSHALMLTGSLGVAATLGLHATAVTQSLEGIHWTLENRLGLTVDDRHIVDGGYEAARMLPASAPDGIAAMGAIWIDARPDTYLRWAEDFADFDRGSSVQAVRRLSNPPVLADFGDLTLSKDDLRELSRCRAGACSMQLDADSIARIDAIDWNAPSAPAEATAIVRRTMLEVALRYTAEGNTGLPHYHDGRRATDVQKNLTSMLDEEAASVRTPQPLLAFLRHGGAPPAGATSYLYWTTNAFGLKPTTRLNQTIVYRMNQGGIAGVIATKQLYASHYFHGGLELRFAVANPALDERFVLVMVTRSRSDGLTGLTGALIGERIRRNALYSLRRYLLYTKDIVEKRQRRGSMQ
jgi:hypothetical protein